MRRIRRKAQGDEAALLREEIARLQKALDGVAPTRQSTGTFTQGTGYRIRLEDTTTGATVYYELNRDAVLLSSGGLVEMAKAAIETLCYRINMPIVDRQNPISAQGSGYTRSASYHTARESDRVLADVANAFSTLRLSTMPVRPVDVTYDARTRSYALPNGDYVTEELVEDLGLRRITEND